MRKIALVLTFLLTLTPLAQAVPTGAKSGSGLIRVRKDSKGPVALELATNSFRNANGTIVDLIGAVHVGERSYYRHLNSDFRQYDAVLYELIAPTGSGANRPIPVPGDTSNPLSAMQSGLKNMLGLSFQLDLVDYRAANFVHADISPDEFQKSMQDKDESFSKIFLRLMTMSADSSDPQTEKELEKLDLMTLLTKGPTPKDQLVLRKVLAGTFTNVDALGDALNGPGGSTLVGVRNQRAISTLQQQMKKGKHHLAIYYGVAHMKDMTARLKALGFQPQGQTWMLAWNLRKIEPVTP
ncbi:unnamed protein product [Phaeothamnion confervicola]